MMEYLNLSMKVVLKAYKNNESDILPLINTETLNHIHNTLIDSLGADIQVLMGDQLSINADMPPNKTLEELFEKSSDLSVVNSSKLSKHRETLQVFARASEDNANNYICSLPIVVKTAKKPDNKDLFIPFKQESIQFITDNTENFDIATFGLGVNQKLSDFFESDYDCLFGVAKVLGVNYSKDTTMINPNPSNLIILPFFSLTSFASVLDESEVLDAFVDWLRKFRATKGILDICEIAHKVIKGNSHWINNPIQESDMEVLESFPELKGLYEEVILSSDKEISKDLPVKMQTFEEATTAIVCSFVNWGDDSIATKIYYPITYEDIELLELVKENLKLEYSNVSDESIELDDGNEDLILKLFAKAKQKLLL